MKLTIQRKLILGFTIVATLCAIVGYVGWNGVSRLEANIQQAGRTSFPALLAISDLKEAQLSIKTSERTLLNSSLELEERLEVLGDELGPVVADDPWASIGEGF